MKGYIYPEGFHTERKPKLPPVLSNHWENATESGLFKKALAEWHKGLREVVNIHYDKELDVTEIEINNGWHNCAGKPFGSPCEYDEKTKSITKIL